MKKKLINETHIEGYVYESKLELKVTGENSKNPGTSYIRGELKIATSDDLTNITSVYYRYVSPTTKQGKENPTFTTLKKIIDGDIKTIMGAGQENAGMVRIDSAIGLNEFYNDNDELVTAKRNDGGFIHLTNELSNPEDRSTFKCDMIITGTKRVEADEERNLPEKLIVKGCTFDFRKALLPVEFVATNPKAMDYFEGLGATGKEPVFTKVWGQQVSLVTVKSIVEESAFGEDSVREVKNTRKEWVITGAAKAPYDWDNEDTIKEEEFDKLQKDREIYLAEEKKRRDDYIKSQQNEGLSFAVSSSTSEYKF